MFLEDSNDPYAGIQRGDQYPTEQAPPPIPAPAAPTQAAGADPNAFDPTKVPNGIPVDWARDFISRNKGDYHRLESAYKSQQTGDQQPNTAQQWTNPTGGAGTVSSAPPDWYQNLIQQLMTQQQQQQQQNQARSDQLYGQLNDRATAALNVNPNDPVIAAQTGAYSADQERAKRNYLADLAESAGPLANLRGESRMASEKLGQNVAGFRAQLLGQELQQQRNQIAQALASEGQLLSADKQLELTQKLKLLDQAIAQQGIGLQQQGLSQDWQKALLNNDQFLAQLGLNAENQGNYWDAIRRGLIGG